MWELHCVREIRSSLELLEATLTAVGTCSEVSNQDLGLSGQWSCKAERRALMSKGQVDSATSCTHSAFLALEWLQSQRRRGREGGKEEAREGS